MKTIKNTLGEIALNVIGMSFRIRPVSSNTKVSLQPPDSTGHHDNSNDTLFSGGITLWYQFKSRCRS